MSCSIIIICFCCSAHCIKMPRFTNRYPVENSSSSTASWKLEMVENSQASWLGSHKFPIAKVTISEQDEKVGRRFFALILLQQILFSSVSFHVFLPVVEYNQLLLSWGVPICVPLGWSSMIADWVVGRVQICKHTETHADTPTQSNLDDCHCTCTTTTDLWSQQQAYAGSSKPCLPHLYNNGSVWSQQQAYLCMQDHHQTLDYCHHSTCTATEICDHNKKPYANPYATVSQSVPSIYDHHLLLLLLLLLLHQNDACSKHLLLRSTYFNQFLQPLSLSHIRWCFLRHRNVFTLLAGVLLLLACLLILWFCFFHQLPVSCISNDCHLVFLCSSSS